MEKFKERFVTVTREKQTKHNIENKIELLEKQKLMLALELESSQKALVEEREDVEQLESVTLSSIVNTILNSKVEKLDKEKEELYAAQLKYEKLKDEYNRIIREAEHLRSALADFDDAERDYQLLIEDITDHIVQKEPEEAEKLKDLLEQRYHYEKERISLSEALGEGEEVLKKLNETKKYMVKAKDWGEYDMSGGGLVATMKKYHYLDEAQELLHHIQWALRKFHNALNHLGMHQDKEIEKFLSVSDYWIDGIFLDYSLQSAIIKLVDSINELIVEVLKIDEELRKEASISANKKEAMQRALDHFFQRVSLE